MQLDRSTTIGTTCVTIFVLSTAVRDVYFGGVLQSVSVFAVLLITFTTATLLGLLLAVFRTNGGLIAVVTSPGDAIAMNVTTALAWTCYFFALKWIEPSIAATLFAGIAPFTVIGLNAIGISIAAPIASSHLQKWLQAGLLGSLGVLVAIVALGYSGIDTEATSSALLGAALALASGALITVSLMFCKRLNEKGASPEALLGTRFLGICILAGAAIASGNAGDNIPAVKEGLELVPLAALLIVAPVYLQQIGVAKIGPLNAKIIATLGPVFVFLMQQFDGRIQWSTPTLCAICLYSTLALLSNEAQRRAHLVSA